MSWSITLQACATYSKRVPCAIRRVRKNKKTSLNLMLSDQEASVEILHVWRRNFGFSRKVGIGEAS